ncbi:MAG: response regulator transcription factor [Gammaproteobacteria bacterium]|nr:response regulator transcription factor [Gammaproteobacteria bacterium]
MKKVRIALVDDHQLVLDGLKSLIESMRNMTVVAQATNGLDALKIAEEQEVDVFVMDISMSGLNGIDTTKRLLELDPGAKVLILSMHTRGRYIAQSFQYGAKGYLLKNTAPDELETAIRNISAGKKYLSPSIGDADHLRVLQQALSDDAKEILTSRQRQILQAIAEGATTRDIAESLSISPKTVESHRSQIMQKLEIDNVPGLVRYAIRHGIIDVG